MDGYQVRFNHVQLNVQDGEYSLNEEGYVIGVSAEVLSTSTDAQMFIGLDEAPNKVPVDQGGGARPYGGFEVCGVPMCIKGLFKWHFTTGVAPKGLLIIATLVPIPIPIGDK